jgi:hypothetical protein
MGEEEEGEGKMGVFFYLFCLLICHCICICGVNKIKQNKIKKIENILNNESRKKSIEMYELSET